MTLEEMDELVRLLIMCRSMHAKDGYAWSLADELLKDVQAAAEFVRGRIQHNRR